MVSTKPVIFFDGLCNFCDNSVQFVMRHERKPTFQFCSLQNRPEEFRTDDFPTSDSVVLYARGKYYEKSDAAVQIAKSLKWYLRWLSVFAIVPKGIRDGIYDFIAARRKIWFGEKEACRIPSPEEKARFIA